MASSTKSLKIFAIIFDVILALFAAVLIAVGLWEILEIESFAIIAYIALGSGILILLTAIFGILGALRESSILSRSFIAILVIFVVIQILALGFLRFVQPPVSIYVNNAFDNLWDGQQVPIPPNNSNRIANLERRFECCGNTGPKDYRLPPNSCFSDNTRLNILGCRQVILNFASVSWLVFHIFVVVLIIVELVCTLVAYILANSIINRWRRSKYYPK